MPTYKNETNRRITFSDKNYLKWDPGDVKALEYFVPHEELGLSMIDERPYVLRNRPRGFGYTEFVVRAGHKTVWWLPYSMTVELTVFSLHQAVRMWVGDCDVPIIVDPNNNHVSRYPWDMSAYLTFEAVDKAADVYVKAEPFTGKGV